MRNRSYSELRSLPTFLDRFEYLSLKGTVGLETFGFERYINQRFYTSREWRLIRQEVLIRDNGCDLGIEDHDIYRAPVIHHMNPMTPDDIRDGNDDILDPEYLITVSPKTHNAIHYGDASKLPTLRVERRPGDTKLW